MGGLRRLLLENFRSTGGGFLKRVEGAAVRNRAPDDSSPSIFSQIKTHFSSSNGLSSSTLPSSSRPLASSLLRYGAFAGMKSISKASPARRMSTYATVLRPARASAAARAGMEVLVAGGPRAEKMVSIWLFGCSAWVFSLVLIGGVTRLTRSGLSMTDWKFTGSLPPFTAEQWKVEFEKYQKSPEYKRVNRGMSIEDFKFIYWMEYAHRMWGRALGVMFALPATYFLAKGFITRQLSIRLSALFALGAGQGLVGWWMVKSGLEEPSSECVQPRVSPYRLAAHLTSAFAIYCGLFWTALSVVMPEPPAGSISWVQGAAKVRQLAFPVSVIVGITAISGAFVAGNDAGHAYNTFPKMGDTWIPGDILSMKPLIRDFFENTSTVQLTHRILATTTLVSIGSLWLATRKLDIHPAVRNLIGNTLGMAALQDLQTRAMIGGGAEMYLLCTYSSTGTWQVIFSGNKMCLSRTLLDSNEVYSRRHTPTHDTQPTTTELHSNGDL